MNASLAAMILRRGVGPRLSALGATEGLRLQAVGYGQGKLNLRLAAVRDEIEKADADDRLSARGKREAREKALRGLLEEMRGEKGLGAELRLAREYVAKMRAEAAAIEQTMASRMKDASPYEAARVVDTARRLEEMDPARRTATLAWAIENDDRITLHAIADAPAWSELGPMRDEARNAIAYRVDPEAAEKADLYRRTAAVVLDGIAQAEQAVDLLVTQPQALDTATPYEVSTAEIRRRDQLAAGDLTASTLPQPPRGTDAANKMADGRDVEARLAQLRPKPVDIVDRTVQDEPEPTKAPATSAARLQRARAKATTTTD